MALEYVVDRIEDDVAVLIDKKNKRPRNVDVEKLPKGVKEGMTLVDTCGTWSIDKDDAQGRSEKIDAKMKDLFRR